MFVPRGQLTKIFKYNLVLRYSSSATGILLVTVTDTGKTNLLFSGRCEILIFEVCILGKDTKIKSLELFTHENQFQRRSLYLIWYSIDSKELTQIDIGHSCYQSDFRYSAKGYVKNKGVWLFLSSNVSYFFHIVVSWFYKTN